MAKKRMFSSSVTDDDNFITLPASAQALYFHLNLHADDDGFLNNVVGISRMVGASKEDVEALKKAGFIITFDDGVIAIRDWRVNNNIAKDRYHETSFKNDKNWLKVDDNGAYYIPEPNEKQTITDAPQKESDSKPNENQTITPVKQPDSKPDTVAHQSVNNLGTDCIQPDNKPDTVAHQSVNGLGTDCIQPDNKPDTSAHQVVNSSDTQVKVKDKVKYIRDIYRPSYRPEEVKKHTSGKPDHIPKPPKKTSNEEFSEQVIDTTNKAIDQLNHRAGTKYRATSKATRKLVRARLNDGWKLDDFYKVINNKVADWKNDSQMAKYLRPETLFGNKFESYLNESAASGADDYPTFEEMAKETEKRMAKYADDDLPF